MVILLTSNGRKFEVSPRLCECCKTIGFFVEEDPDVDLIPLPMVNSKQLGKIIDFFDHEEDGSSFFRDDVVDDLLELALAANYLDCDILLHALSNQVASRLIGKTRDEMREILNIENDFTPEEEAQIIAENAWAF